MAKPKAESSIANQVPFAPSWIDHLIIWIDDLPIPAWLFYVLVMLATVLLTNLPLWIDGSVPFGTVGSIPGQVIFPPLTFYFLVLYHYLTRVGSRSLRTFRPLLAADDVQIAQIDHELGALPRALGWVAIVLSLPFLPPFFLGTPLAFGGVVPRTALPYVIAIPVALFFGATFMCVVFRSIRQLRMVHQLHIKATNISLLKLAPAHAFSALTARTGIAVLIFVVLEYLYNPVSATSAGVVGYFVPAMFAVAIFVIPLIGMRDRLVEEKKRAADAISDLLQVTSDRLQQKIRDSNYQDIRETRDAIEALIRERELFTSISTWPWNPLTVRAFATTLLLPILLWLVTRLLERFF